ncbi:MAG: hypothetical protein ACREPA_10860, partial [Candidatus Dormibacteraceae bacterium]
MKRIEDGQAERLHEAAHQSWRLARTTWNAVQESARSRADDPSVWAMEAQAWDGYRSAADCKRAAWELFEAEMASQRERARAGAQLHDFAAGGLERAAELGAQRAIDRARSERRDDEVSVPAPPPSVLDTEPGIRTRFEAMDVTSGQGADELPMSWHPQELLAPEAMVPGAAAGEAFRVEDFAVRQFASDPAAEETLDTNGGGDMVTRIRRLLAEQAVVRQDASPQDASPQDLSREDNA